MAYTSVSMAALVSDRYEDDRDVSLMAQDQYFRELKWVEPLALGEEKQLLGRLVRASREPGNAWRARLAREARDRLVEAYQPLVVKIASGTRSWFRSMEVLDLVNEGSIGLLEAIEEYPRRETFHDEGGFSRLAAVCIRHALSLAYRDRDSMVRVSHRVTDDVRRARRVADELAERFGRAPLQAELAEALEMSEEALTEMMGYSKRRSSVESLQGLLREEDAEDRHDFVSLYQQAEAAEVARQEELEQMFQQAFQRVLTDYQREVVMLRYGVGEGTGPLRSEQLVGEMLGRTAQTVWRTETFALEKLRQVVKVSPSASGGFSYCVDQATGEEYYTAKEAAQVLGVRKNWVGILRQRGVLSAVERPGYKGRWMFPKEVVHAYKAELSLWDGYYTVADVARLIGVTITTVSNWLEKGQLAGEQVRLSRWKQAKWRIPKGAAHAYAAARVVPVNERQLVSA